MTTPGTGHTAGGLLRLPEPPAELRSRRITAATILKFFGPGAIIASLTIGSGESILASREGAVFGYTVLWAVVLAALTAVGFTGVLLAPGTALVWASAVVLGIAQGAIFGLALTLFGLRAPDSETTAALSGMAQGAGYLIAAAGPLLIGVVHGATGGWTIPLVLLVAGCAAEIALGAAAGRARSVRSVIAA